MSKKLKAVRYRSINIPSIKGGKGKSLFMDALASYYESLGISVQGWDLDADNRNFSGKYQWAKLLPLTEEPEAQYLKIWDSLSKAPVTLTDPRAHSTEGLYSAFKGINALDRAEELGIAFTVVLIPYDGADALDNVEALSRAVEFFKGSPNVKFVEIRNLFNSRTFNTWDAGRAKAWLRDNGGIEIEFPKLLSTIGQAADAARIRNDREGGYSFTELISDASPLKLDYRLLLDSWLRDRWASFSEHADAFLPDAEAEVVKGAFSPVSEAERPAAQPRSAGFDLNALD